MVRCRNLQKGKPPPDVGGGGRKQKKKYIGQNQGGDTELKGVGGDHGIIRQSMWNHPEKNVPRQGIKKPIK